MKRSQRKRASRDTRHRMICANCGKTRQQGHLPDQTCLFEPTKFVQQFAEYTPMPDVDWNGKRVHNRTKFCTKCKGYSGTHGPYGECLADRAYKPTTTTEALIA